MLKRIYKSPILTAAYLFLVTMVAGILFGLIADLLKLESGFSGVSLFIGAFIVGQGYGLTLKKEMEQKFRLRVTLYFSLIQFILALLLLLLLGLDILISMLVLVIVTLILASLTYFMLGFASRQALKQLEVARKKKK